LAWTPQFEDQKLAEPLMKAAVLHHATREYKLKDANQALLDLHHGKVKGRAVLIP